MPIGLRAYDEWKVRTQRLPSARLDNAATPGLLGGSTADIQRFGQGVENLSGTLSTIASDMQREDLRAQEQAKREADQLRVDDALNQVREQAITLTVDPEQGYQ